MARVTVEDCLEHVENRFHLVLVASKRARQLMKGIAPTVERENDKATVIALREIAEGNLDIDNLQHEQVQDVSEVDDEATTDAVDGLVAAAGEQAGENDNA